MQDVVLLALGRRMIHYMYRQLFYRRSSNPFINQTWDIPSYYFRANTINSCADVPSLLHLVRSELAVAFFLATTFVSKLLIELPIYPHILEISGVSEYLRSLFASVHELLIRMRRGPFSCFHNNLLRRTSKEFMKEYAKEPLQLLN